MSIQEIKKELRRQNHLEILIKFQHEKIKMARTFQEKHQERLNLNAILKQSIIHAEYFLKQLDEK